MSANPTGGSVRAALYARISSDKRDGAGVNRQLDDARARAEREGWTVVGEFVDNDVSAYTGKRRDEYERLMEAVQHGDINKIVVYQSSRLWRAGPERAADLAFLAEHGVSVAVTAGPDMDLDSAGGRMLAGILGEFDTAESAIKSERLRRAALERAQSGRPHNSVLYGWRRVDTVDPETQRAISTDVIDEDAAAVIKEITERLLGGDSLTGMAREFTERSLPTPKNALAIAAGREPNHSTRWTLQTIRGLVLREANVGLRVHKGEIVGEGAWAPILDEDDWRAACAILKDPARRTTGPRAGERRHLLTYGIAFCGRCDGTLAIGYPNKKADGTRQAAYKCRKGCTSRSKEPLDAYVTAVVLERLAADDARELFLRPSDVGEVDEASAMVDRLRARVNGAADQYADGVLDGEQLARITSRLRPELQAAESKLAMLLRADGVGADAMDLLHAGDPTEAWSVMDLERRHRVLVDLGVRVTLHKAKARGRAPFDPKSIDIEFGT